MILVPYTLTALSRQDIVDTPTDRNIVTGAVVTATDINGAAVIMYDDAAGANGSTSKQTDINGQLTVFVESGEYTFSVNGRAIRATVRGRFDVQSIDSIATLRTVAGQFDGQQASLSSYYASGNTGGGVFVWDAASTAADDGGVTIAVTGVATGRWVRQLEGFVTPEMFGAVGDGVTNDTTAVQATLNYASGKAECVVCNIYAVDGFVVPNNVRIRAAMVGAGFTGSGIVNGRNSSAQKQFFEGVSFYGSLELQIGGSSSSSFASEIYVKDVFISTSGAFGVQMFFSENSGISNLTIEMAGNIQGHGVKLGNIRNSSFEDIYVSGDVSIGVSATGTASLLISSLEACFLRNINVSKNDGYPNISGDHGVYLLGMKNCVIDGVFVKGSWTTASTYSVKFRDSHDCTWSNIFCKTFRVTADNNTIFNANTLRNKISNVTCEGFYLFKDAGGSVSDLIIKDLDCDLFESNAIDGPVIIKGKFNSRQAGDIRLDGCVFDGADVTIQNMSDSATRFRFGLKAKNSTINNIVRVFNSNAEIYNCNVSGGYSIDSTGGSYTTDIHNCFFDGELFANSFGARTMTAYISNTTFNADENAVVTNNPNVKKYRFVAFNNAVYDTLTV